MSDKEITIRKLQTFRKRKHTQMAFYDVDLEEYQIYVDGCVGELLDVVEQDASDRQKKSILIRYLKYLRGMRIIETEEREYVTHEFYELSQIVGVNVSFHLNRVIYGLFMIIATKALKVLYFWRRPKERGESDNGRIREEFEITCTDCQYKMLGDAAFYESDTQNDVWLGKVIVECPVCGTYNLVFFEDREGYHGFVQGDYRVIEDLDTWPREDYSQKMHWTREQAEQRLQQIKYWRKG
ncbi:hypothetical protein [Dysgonomonas sp. 25]|uniref:hypothetical protein n=1 Tax=Dysgonomonas sp. 25 TaxID=2302933 RepID=UPI0013D6F34D|nr:hypothetical protein [Dysgonomonas sp. 25]NDV70089.1 hypothetical protein [Dysgonomonas sp. 25]